MDEEICQLYHDAGINGGKGYPNGTSKHQSWDDNDSYKDTKAGVKKVCDNSIDVSNELLQASLVIYFEQLKAAFPTVTVSASLKKKIVYGCEVMTYVWPSAITRLKLIQGFKNTAQVATNPPYQHIGYEKTTVDLRKMVGLCESTVSDEELANLELNMPELVANIHRDGENNDDAMDLLGIMKTGGAASRQGNVIIILYSNYYEL